MREDLILLTSIMLLATLAPPRKILVPMTPEHWKILTTSPSRVETGGIFIYNYGTDWNAFINWVQERPGATTLKIGERSNAVTIQITCNLLRGDEEVCSGVISIGAKTFIWLPLHSAWGKIQSLLRSLDDPSIDKFTISPPKPTLLSSKPIGNPAQNSYAIKVIWHFRDYSPEVVREYTRDFPSPKINNRVLPSGHILLDIKQILLPKDFSRTHPFMAVYKEEILNFAKTALTEYPPTTQPSPIDPNSSPNFWDIWTVLNEAQVKYIDCLVERASGKDITCERP